MIFADRLKLLRKAKKLTQQDLASIINKIHQTVYKYEKNLLEPDIKDLEKIKQAMPELNLEWLITGNGEMFIKHSIVTGDIKGSNITVQNNAKCECLEDKELEMLQGFRKLSDEKKKYYYFKIMAESMEN